MGNDGPGGVRFPYSPPLAWQVTRVSPYVRGPFPSKEIRRISGRDDPGPPVVPGGLGIGLGSRTLERADWSLLCVAERVPQGQTESWGIVLAANAGPRVPSGGVTLKRRCTSDLQSSLIVNKLLSLSLSLPPSDYVALKYWCWRTGEEPLHAEYGQVQRGVSSVYHQLSHSSPGSWCLLQPVA